ncbi:MAG: hypothetical protein ACTHLA_14960 [Asticcacaulis sp.]|uniref:hypothetical protein n=1 Tax=Asticcacaulis sp. TaxID=1872648 RepID=UPI003F7CCC5C
MQCPKCDTQDCFLCSIAHAQGKTTTKTTGSTSGAYYGTNGNAGMISGSHTSTSTSLTAFGKKAAPPENPLGPAISFVALAIVSNMIVHGIWPHLNGLVTLIFLGGIGLSLWGLYAAIRDQPRFRNEKARWEQSWICARCGEIFLPPERASLAPQTPAAQPS